MKINNKAARSNDYILAIIAWWFFTALWCWGVIEWIGFVKKSLIAEMLITNVWICACYLGMNLSSKCMKPKA